MVLEARPDGKEGWGYAQLAKDMMMMMMMAWFDETGLRGDSRRCRCQKGHLKVEAKNVTVEDEFRIRKRAQVEACEEARAGIDLFVAIEVRSRGSRIEPRHKDH